MGFHMIGKGRVRGLRGRYDFYAGLSGEGSSASRQRSSIFWVMCVVYIMRSIQYFVHHAAAVIAAKP
jgi:hypothetical protein